MPASNHYNSLELKWVAAWHNQSWWLWLLMPVSWLYGCIMAIRRWLYKQRILSSYRAPVAVMVVGNITVGGSGKTPLIIELVEFLQWQGIKIGVISRGYGGNEKLMPMMVNQNSQPSDVGDEPCLIVRETGVLMSVSPNRQQAIELLLKHAPDTQLIIADDGLQHYKLQRDIEWIVVDSDRGFGNKQLLPTGFLREPIYRLQGATVIWHQAVVKTAPIPLKPTGGSPHLQISQDQLNDFVNTSKIPQTETETLTDINRGIVNEMTMVLQPSKPYRLTADHHRLMIQSRQSKVLDTQNDLLASEHPDVYAISGIGYPQRFFNTLKGLGFTVIPHPKPDHHVYTVDDLVDLTEFPIVTTSKDAVKISSLLTAHPKLASLDIWVLPVKAALSVSCYETLMVQLEDLGISAEQAL